MTDEQILQLIKSSSEKERGYRVLMSTYQEMLYQHIRRIVKNHEDTNDVLQNTFIKIFKHIAKFEGRSSLYTWIYRIATNEALTQVKKTQKLLLVQDRNEVDNGLENQLAASNSPESESISEMLVAAMETLPDKQRSVFSLRYYEEMSYREMSSVMGTSEGALKASFHHAVKKIEQYFKQVNIY